MPKFPDDPASFCGESQSVKSAQEPLNNLVGVIIATQLIGFDAFWILWIISALFFGRPVFSYSSIYIAGGIVAGVILAVWLKYIEYKERKLRLLRSQKSEGE